MNSSDALNKRCYADCCAAAHALDLVGERWALLIVRELLLGPKRFGELRSDLPGISANVLTQRLNELESAQVLQRCKLPRPASVHVYALTDWGMELESIVLQLARWGARSWAYQRGAALGPDALILSLKAMFNQTAAGRKALAVDLTVAGRLFRVQVAKTRFNAIRLNETTMQTTAPAPAPRALPDAAAQADSATFLALAFGGLHPDDAVRAGRLRYQGSLPALQRFLSLFSLPSRYQPPPASLASPAP
ncbi:transcriptional regulator [Allopusillimonas soli]|uniref:Helix-turn-helix transcriptional regulator n=1 Tax=Allopusillimonas soli TaxID=659016 RepID=A0A853F7F3_9BURK|nr:helix-turn-helix domain-containing protein [Allopusillimonas soli]NYT36524.1 helix-turn-helix transcriptional regulator [Allopusillimonas soli]TEA75025.1 transcriptional regulator [Allopusillimonas soli]